VLCASIRSQVSDVSNHLDMHEPKGGRGAYQKEAVDAECSLAPYPEARCCKLAQTQAPAIASECHILHTHTRACDIGDRLAAAHRI
jgi:hypothetical protein